LIILFSDDLFTIEEVSIHDGEWKDTTFSTSSDTMDGVRFYLLVIRPKKCMCFCY
jgi:hypothetical protein